MTFDKYSAKDFLSNNYYNETSNIRVTDLEKTVTNSIINLSKKMPLGKVPGPVYVMFAKKLEYNGFKFGSCLDDIYANGNKASCYNSQNNNYSFISNFATLDDIKKSNLSNFTYKNNYEIYILYPNLTPELKYFTNYSNYVMTNEHIYNILTDPYLYQIINNNDKVDYQESKRILIEGLYVNPNYISSINNSIKKLKKKSNSVYNNNNDILCAKGGCSCDYGEDLKNIFTINGQQENAYVPNKCLMQLNTNNNIRIDNNTGLKNIKSNISTINNIGNIYNNTKFNNKSNNNYLELNAISSEYPGIQEIVFSAVQINCYHNAVNNYMLNLPWGNILLCKYYVITDNNNDLFTLKPEDILLSPNGKYFLYFNSSGQIGIYKKIYISNFIHCKLYYTLNNNLVVNSPINLAISNNSLIINTKTNNNVIIPIGNTDNTNSPFAIILDNDGYLRMYGDYFTDITSSDFINYINKSIKKTPNISMNIYQDKNGTIKII